MKKASFQTGFTLIEILVVISIISFLASMVVVSTRDARERGKAGQAAAATKAIKTALEIYNDRMGFYPPDVGRGWDPGFNQPLPYNPDTGKSSIPNCNHCPAGWDVIVTERWDGPYLQRWPSTSWGGKYDYQYWTSNVNRYGCVIPPGIYIGVQGNYQDLNRMTATAEQWLLDKGIDSDGCLNAEAQVLFLPL